MRAPALAIVVVVVLGLLLPATAAFGEWRDRPLEGFGASTPGGAGGSSYVVTSLANSGPGTLRDAISASNRVITFAVGGTIHPATELLVSGNHITINALTAPSPGITITGDGSSIDGAVLDVRGHDIIIRGLRVCDSPNPDTGDNIRIWDGAYNVVVDHCSVRRPGDGNLDISDEAHDITVQWSIIADGVKNSLMRTDIQNISLHHNLYVFGDERNPQLDDAATIDMVNNVIYGWASNYGTRIRNLSSANVVANYYIPDSGSDASDALVLENTGAVYVSGNVIPSACHVSGTTSTRLPAPAVTEMSCEAARQAVLNEAGAQPRDAEDADYVSHVGGSSVDDSMTWGSIKAMYR